MILVKVGRSFFVEESSETNKYFKLFAFLPPEVTSMAVSES
jgi:hypothetical protein